MTVDDKNSTEVRGMAAKKTTKKAGKKKTKKKTVRKVAKKKRPRGRPPGSKSKKKRRTGSAKVGRKALMRSITLPVDKPASLNYWSDMVVFLNSNQGKSFIVQMDGTSYTLNAT